jgi:hypothetical protein
MASDTISTRADGDIIDQTWFNVIQSALGVDLVPRNASGVATDQAGSVGTSTYRFLNGQFMNLLLFSNNTKKVTIKSPNSLAADYSWTLPGSLPSAQSVLTVDASGVMERITPNEVALLMTSTGANFIRSTMTKGSGTSVTAGNVAIAASSGSYSTTSTSYVNVSNQSITIVHTGKPVRICLIPGGVASIGVDTANTNGGTATFQILASGTSTLNAEFPLVISTSDDFATPLTRILSVPPGGIDTIDIVGAGTTTYILRAKKDADAATAYVTNCRLVAYELA